MKPIICVASSIQPWLEEKPGKNCSYPYSFLVPLTPVLRAPLLLLDDRECGHVAAPRVSDPGDHHHQQHHHGHGDKPSIIVIIIINNNINIIIM